MKFWEAMKAMEEGKKVRNEEWSEHQYIYLDKNDKSIIDEEEDYFPIRYIEDEEIWEIYEEKKDVDPRFKEFYHYLKDENGFTNGEYGEFIYERNEEDHLLAFYRQLLEMAKYYKLD